MLGLLAAYGTIVVIAFLGGCGYAMTLGRGDGGVAYSAPLVAVFGIGLVAAITAAQIGAVGACVFALPLFWSLLRYRVSSVIAYLGAGVLVAGAVTAIFAVLHYYADFLIGPDFRFGILAIATCGPLAGLMFWIVAVRGKPICEH
jgi:hypothetical protein